MSDLAIQVENLGKKYRMGNHAPYARFTELLTGMAKAPLKALGRAASSDHKAGRPSEFWALSDVNFEVKQGDIVGVIGRNGAGKSTLLKLLSRITQPTTGRIRYRGRVGSLLEVGTGFHPELTGRDNIFLNGAILGMTRAEVRRRFDEIVAFSEVEKFLDTAVKHYSSGMYMRLAFAVAAHLEPEILLVDEVLAVGDAEFQKKCLGKMGQVAKDGRTILFVSHNMSAIESLCHSAIRLDQGKVVESGPAAQVIQSYITASQHDADAQPLADRVDRQGDGRVRVTGFKLLDDKQQPASFLRSGHDGHWQITLHNKTSESLAGAELSIGMDDSHGQRIAHLSTSLCGTKPGLVPPGETILDVSLPRLSLAPGRYCLTFYLTAGGQLADWLIQAVWFEVEGGSFYPTGRLPEANTGPLLLDHQMTFNTSPAGQS